DAVGDGVVDAREHHRSSVMAVDEVHVPQRLGGVERGAHQLADEVAQGLVSPGRGKRDVADVVADVEMRVVLPVEDAGSQAGADNALVESPKGGKAFVEQRAQPLEVDIAVECQYTRHHHQVGRVLHPQPRRIDARHRDQSGHRAVILRAIDGDFRGFDGHPNLGPGGEVKVAHGRWGDLGHQRNSSAQADPDTLALQVEIFGPAAPDVARRALGPGEIQRDRARVDDRKYIALAGLWRGHDRTALELDVITTTAAAEKVDAGQVGDEP